MIKIKKLNKKVLVSLVVIAVLTALIAPVIAASQYLFIDVLELGENDNAIMMASSGANVFDNTYANQTMTQYANSMGWHLQPTAGGNANIYLSPGGEQIGWYNPASGGNSAHFHIWDSYPANYHFTVSGY